MDRRSFLRSSVAVGAGVALGVGAPAAHAASGAGGDQTPGKNIYWGDIHNHNAVGYAKGSLERAYDIARSHLDFFCFTGHSQWHDMPEMPQDKHLKWVRGFKVMKDNWEKVKRLAGENHQPGEFVPFIGYEWHSSSCGDVCIIFPGSDAELVYIEGIREFQKFARDRGAILIPHHPAYQQGWRGQNWSVLDPEVSPVVEIFSEHGNAESDRGPHRYITISGIPALTARGLLPFMPRHLLGNPLWRP
ncbi:MAG: twin-arginine translocation signal domain-containing protein [Planctomycetota bacterium]